MAYQEFQVAIQELSRQGIGKRNLYKFFLPEVIGYTIHMLNLDCTKEELANQWLEHKDKL